MILTSSCKHFNFKKLLKMFKWKVWKTWKCEHFSKMLISFRSCWWYSKILQKVCLLQEENDKLLNIFCNIQSIVIKVKLWQAFVFWIELRQNVAGCLSRLVPSNALFPFNSTFSCWSKLKMLTKTWIIWTHRKITLQLRFHGSEL